jgi:adenine-specific DNA-methyltransferase
MEGQGAVDERSGAERSRPATLGSAGPADPIAAPTRGIDDSTSVRSWAMAKKRAAKGPGAPVNGDQTGDPGLDYRHHHARRLNNPTAGNAPEGKVERTVRKVYEYDPHRPPTLRYDATGRADAVTERMAGLLAESQSRPLTADEAAELADALRQGQPWLEWAGKHEQPAFVVDAPAIHIHERVSTRALLRVAARRDVQRSLFGETDLSYTQSVQFYHHAVNWVNRLILGDNRAAIASLAHREDLAGKVQMIYIDPPYGIRYGSNFQPEVGNRDVKDKASDLTREVESVNAYRDTWNLGVHSYISYISACLRAAKALLNDRGSVFVQIGDENLHLIRNLLDETFGKDNFVGVITYAKTTGTTGTFLASTSDYIVWYAKNKSTAKYNPLYSIKQVGGEGATLYNYVQLPSGERRPLSAEERLTGIVDAGSSRIMGYDTLVSPRVRESRTGYFEIEIEGKRYLPKKGEWKTNREGIRRLTGSDRVAIAGNNLSYVRFMDDFGAYPLSNVWTDTVGQNQYGGPKLYTVQTALKAVQRCMLMTTDPGDLVLDPTCGSGTTAYVAEQWGRRWITIDTSRVALAIARQRIMTAKFDYYRLRDEAKGPSGGFYYKTVPHVMLKTIAQNVGLDPIFARHEGSLAELLSALNAALGKVTPELRAKLECKLAAKRRAKNSDDRVTDADERRWSLPTDRWEEWQVPFDIDPDWPKPLQEALAAYRAAWRAKRDEVDAAIAANAKPEALVDQPEPVKGIVRVSGPFTVEALQPAEESLDDASPVDPLDDELDTFEAGGQGSATNAEAYLDKMIRLLKADGVRFPNNVQVGFDRLDPIGGGILSAVGEWHPEGSAKDARSVAVVIGPQYGPIAGDQVESALRAAYRAKVYDDLVFAGFSFDSGAQTQIQDDPNPKVRSHLAFIRPDVILSGLLKETPQSQLFTVFGLPRARLESVGKDRYRVVMEGVDVYNPVKNEILATGADKVAAWFLDSDYDGRTFCICQAFFPNRSAWDKLGKALKGVLDEDALESFSGTESQPFDAPTGAEPRVAVKVIDPRGNEVLRVLRVPRGV